MAVKARDHRRTAAGRPRSDAALVRAALAKRAAGAVAPPRLDPPSPAARALAAALAGGRDVAGQAVFSPDAAAEITRAVRALFREELGLALGTAAMRLSEPDDR